MVTTQPWQAAHRRKGKSTYGLLPEAHHDMGQLLSIVDSHGELFLTLLAAMLQCGDTQHIYQAVDQPRHSTHSLMHPCQQILPCSFLQLLWAEMQQSTV
jgi:hypothetical protein